MKGKNNSLLINLISSRKTFYILFSIVGFGWLALTLFRYFFLGFNAWDTVLHIQPTINFVVNDNYYNNILFMHPIANHFRPGMLLFYPFVKLFPTGLWMMFAKVIAFLTCPFILIHMGRLLLKEERFIYVLPIFWLINDPLSNVVASQSVSTTLMPPFILLAFLFAWKGRYLYMYVCLFFLLLFKESMALVWLSMGMFLMVEKKEFRHGAFIVCLGIVWGLLTNLYIMPLFSNGNVTNSSLLAPFEFYYPKFLMLLKSFLAVGLVPFIHPASLLYILPAYSLYLVSRVTGAFWLTGHYHDFTMTIMYVGILFSLKVYTEKQTFFNKISSKKKIGFIKFAAVCLILAGMVKLPYWVIETGNLKERFQVKQSVDKIKPELDRESHVWVAENLAFYFMDFPKMNAIGFHGIQTEVFNFDESFYLIYPDSQKYSMMSESTYKILSEKVEEGVASGKFIKLDSSKHLNLIYYKKK